MRASRFSFAIAVSLLALTAPSAHAAGHGKGAHPKAPDATSPSSTSTVATTPVTDVQVDAATEAAVLKKQGDDEMETLRFAEAEADYKKAYQLAPSAVLMYNRARALQGLGNLGEALTLFEQFNLDADTDTKARVHGFDKLLAEVRSQVTTLSITCNVPGVPVRIYGKTIGTTPFDHPLRVNAGTTVLEASEDGYFPVRRDLTLPGGGVASVDLHLDSKQVNGILSLTSPVVGADVMVDGRALGKVPLETVLGSGMHTIQIKHDGYAPLKTDTVIAAGERKDLDLPLEKNASVATKWWFWTAIGAVVVGGTVTGIALASTRSPDKGTIAPGTASTPLTSW